MLVLNIRGRASSTWENVGLKHQVSLNYLFQVNTLKYCISEDELRPAVRTLFDATIKNLSDQEAIEIFEKWQHFGLSRNYILPCLAQSSIVPTLQPDAEKESLTAALALSICGSIASEKYSMLSAK